MDTLQRVGEVADKHDAVLIGSIGTETIDNMVGNCNPDGEGRYQDYRA